jgi:predicted O-methyltransferase YrrM
MINFGVDEVQGLASEFGDGPDERPEWLRQLDTDETSVYYRFFFEFARRFRPAIAFEIGTCEGKSAAHLAAGNPEGVVITLDIKPQAKSLADALLLPNLVSVTCDSMAGPQLLRWMPSIDLLFIDGDHTLPQAYGEYELYRPFVKDGGLIFFDDIHISPEMEFMWRTLADPKEDLRALHYTGFGVVRKDSAVRPLSLDSVTADFRGLGSRNEARSLK